MNISKTITLITLPIISNEEAGTEVFNSEKQEEINENYFSNFCEFRLISKGVASAPTVCSFLKNETKVFLTFVPHSSSKK